MSISDASAQITPPSTVPPGITYVRSGYNWSQSPTSPTTLTGGSPAVVTLSPCPIGIDTTSGAGYQVYVSGGGNSEAVNVETIAGDCTYGASSGTIHFTPFNSYAAGYTVGSASSGIQETINLACGTSATYYQNLLCNVTIPANSYANGESTPPSNAWTVYGTIFLHANQSVLSGYGVSLNCGGLTGGTITLRGPCLQVGDLNNSNHYVDTTVQGIHFRANINQSSNPSYAGVPITQTCVGSATGSACNLSAGVAQITTASAHGFRIGDMVTIEFTDNPAYWGDAVVTAVPSSTTFQYQRGNGNGNITSQTTPGVVALTYVAVLDNGLNSHFIDLATDKDGEVGAFNNWFDMWDDENAVIDHFNNNAISLNANASWTGAFVFSGGAANVALPMQQLAPVITLRDSTITANYSNGVTDYNSNGLYIENTVIQASGLWQVYSSNTAGNYQGAYIKNIYSESRAGLNPFWAVNGSVTSGAFSTNEKVQQANTGATAYLENAVVGSEPMLLGALAGAPDSTDTWKGQVSGAIYTPTSLPASKSPLAGLGVAGLIAGPSTGAAFFEIAGSGNVQGAFPTGQPVFALTSVNGSGVYQGNITYGASNALVGQKFTISGFQNSNNNLTNAPVIASTSTSLTFSANTTAETNSAAIATLTLSPYPYTYYIVVNDTTTGQHSSPLQILNWLSTGNDSIPVTWPRVANVLDGITYDVIRMTTPSGVGSNYPYIGGCNGGGFGICGKVNSTAVAQCSGLVCGFQDNGGVPTSSYTINQGNYSGNLSFWPGALVVAGGTDNSGVRVDNEQSPVVGIGLSGNAIQTATKCTGFGSASPGGYTTCLASETTFNNSVPNQTATIMTDGPAAGGGTTLSKGRLNFSSTSAAELQPHHIITLIDSQPSLTQATAGYRPGASTNDTWIGTDVSSAGVGLGSGQLAFGAPISISNYIANTGDNASFLERLTSAEKLFAVPIYGVNTSALTSAKTITATTLTSTGIVLPTVPTSTTVHGRCSLIWEQSGSAAGVSFGLGMNNAPVDLWVAPPTIWNGSTMTGGSYTVISTTTPQSIASITPIATGPSYKLEFDFTLETISGTGANPVTLTVYGETSNSNDALVIQPGSACGWQP